MGRPSKNSRSQLPQTAGAPPKATDVQDSESWHPSAFLQPSNLIAAASAVLALIALGISMRGCQLASEANQLAQLQYREDRQLVLQAEFAENGDRVTLRSISDAATFLEGRAYFPTEISKEVWPIQPSEKVLHLVSAKYGVQEAIRKRVPAKSGVVQVSTDGKIPMLIDSYYASRGEAYQDRSIYLLGVEFVVGEDTSAPPTVKFTGLTFFRRLDAEKPVDRKMLDEMLNSAQGIHVPPRVPR